MKYRILLFVALFVGNFCSYGQTIAGWQLNGTTGAELSSNASALNVNLNTSTLVRNGGIAASALASSFSSNTFTAFGTKADAVTNNKCLSFTINPVSGFQASLSTLDVRFRRSSTGPNAMAWFYSIDGTTFTQIGADISFTATTTGGVAQTQLNLSGIPALQNVASGTTITIRLNAWGASAATGTFAIGRSLTAGAADYSLAIGGTVTSAGPYTVSSGDWNVASTWSTNPVVPVSTDNVTITAGHTVYTTSALTRTGTTTVNGTFELRNGGSASGTNFNYNATNSGLNFNDSANYTVNNPDVFWPATNSPFNVTVLQGGMTMNATTLRTVAGTFAVGGAGVTITSPSSLTLNGTCQINTGGFFNNSPIYGSSSTLIYNTGGTFNRGNEWQALGVGTIGSTPGYPNHVQLSSATTLNYNNGTPLAKAINGNLTIDSGSSFYMDFGAGASGGFLTVAGNVTNDGNFTLGNAVGDDLKIGGNFSNGASGVFNGNNRALYFTRVGLQTVSNAAAATLTFPYVVLSGGTTVQLFNNNLIVSAPLGGNAISFTNTSDVIDLNGRTLRIGTAGVANTVTGLGTFKGSTASRLFLDGTGSIGTLNFTTGFQNLGTLVMNRSAGAIGCVMGTPVAINTALTLTNGLIDLGATTMTLAATCSNVFTASANSFVIADNTAGGILRKAITDNVTTYNFPIGDKIGTLDYTPARFTSASGSSATAFLGVSVQDFALATDKHPNLDATTDYISRYWALTTSGTFTAPISYTFAADYITADVNGAEVNCRSNQWNGTAWSGGGSATGGNTLTIGGITTLPTTNHITKGWRNAEINVKQAVTDYLDDSNYTFANTVIGSPTDVIFTVYNLGEQTLTLSPPAPAITGDPSYTIFANPATSVAASGSTTFTIRFAPTVAGTFTGKITITTNDPSGGENLYVINFIGTAVTPFAEINVTGNANTIAPANVPSALDNTLFGPQPIATTSAAKVFAIQSLGNIPLLLSGATPFVTLGGANPGDFAISAAPLSSINAGASSNFSITFTPTSAGTRTATVTITSNDTDEGSYTFNIRGNGACSTTTIATVTPSSGPVGTDVIITASVGDLSGTTVMFNAIPATIISSSATQLIVTVPEGATTGNIVITKTATSCITTTPFAVINKTGACAGLTELIMTEIYDKETGSLGYIEVYNGTGSTIDLTTYFIRRFGDSADLLANNYTDYGFSPSITSIANGAVRYGKISVDANTASPNFTFSNAAGINEEDIFYLYHGTTIVDVYVVPNNNVGYTAKRNLTTIGPNTTSNSSDWTHTTTETLADLGLFPYVATTSNIPTVNTDPVDLTTCNLTASFSVTATAIGAGTLAYQWSYNNGVASGWAPIAAGTFLGVTASGFASSTLSFTGGIGTMNGYQFYCQVSQDGSCAVASDAAQLTVSTTIWNGTAWSNLVPTLAKQVIINGNYNMNVPLLSFEACSVYVKAPFVLTITGNNYVAIQNNLTVEVGANVIIENNGSLVQHNDAAVNSGAISMKRNANIRKSDYVYWSSSVAGFASTAISPLTATSLIYKWNPTLANANLGEGTWVAGNETMVPGKGYIVRGPSTFNNTAPQVFTATFTGTPYNGIVQPSIARGTNLNAGSAGPNGVMRTTKDDNWNLIGNPYPCSIDAIAFLTANTNIEGSIRLWTHGTLPSAAIGDPFYGNYVYNYTSNDYITYNLSGVSSGPSAFNGYIASGQSFFVVMNDGLADATQTVTFNNSLRSSTYNNAYFYRNNSMLQNQEVIEKSRIWLDLIDANTTTTRTLIAYVDGATLEKDRLYDAYTKIGASQSIYSLINEEIVAIQGRPLPFSTEDTVPLGVNLTASTAYTIAIGAVDGLFENESQAIYLEDKTAGVIHNLKQAPYSFTAAPGRLDTRFVLRYTTTSTLDNLDFETNNATVAVVSNKGQISVKSTVENIQSVVIYDIVGREVFNGKNINATDFSITDVVLNQQALIVKVLLENGQTVTKKIVF